MGHRFLPANVLYLLIYFVYISRAAGVIAFFPPSSGEFGSKNGKSLSAIRETLILNLP